MKRLALKNFIQKQETPKSNTDKLLGQVLGNCHDTHQKFNNANSGVSNEVTF